MWNGICFWGVEHLFYYITRKTEDERERIYACDNQSISVRAKNTKLRPDWDDIKIDFMKEMLRAKFHQGGRKLAQKLVDTGDIELLERNSWNSYFWGVDPDGNGENWLGILLMEVRDEVGKELENGTFKEHYEPQLYKYTENKVKFQFTFEQLLQL